MQPKISIALATYNGEKYLREQLDSLYNQTLLPSEIIVCDDNSTDGTVEILREYKEKKGLKYYVNNPGLGVNGNFFKAISLCSSEFISICDQDDVWFPEKLQRLYNALLPIANNGIAVVSSSVCDVDGELRPIEERNRGVDSFGYKNLYRVDCNQGCTLMFTSQLKDYVLKKIKDHPCNVMYDAILAYVGMSLGENYHIAQALMYYRHHNANVIAKYQPNNLSFREKTLSRKKYVGYVGDLHFSAMAEIYSLIKEDVVNPNVHLFYKRMNLIGNSNNVKGSLLLLFIHEIPFAKRFRVCVKSIVSSFLKYIYKLCS